MYSYTQGGLQAVFVNRTICRSYFAVLLPGTSCIRHAEKVCPCRFRQQPRKDPSCRFSSSYPATSLCDPISLTYRLSIPTRLSTISRLPLIRSGTGLSSFISSGPSRHIEVNPAEGLAHCARGNSTFSSVGAIVLLGHLNHMI